MIIAFLNIGINIIISMITNKELLEEIKSSKGNIDKRSIIKVLKKYNLYDCVLKIKPDNISEAFYWYINGLTSCPKLCKNCGKPLTFFTFKYPYSNHDYCSTKCAAHDNITKSKQTLLKRYGVTHQMYLDTVKDKIRQTCENKYNHNWYLGSDTCAKQIKETVLKKYNVEHVSQIDEIKEKKKRTFLLRYGYENTDINSPILNKSRKTLSDELKISYPNDFSFQQLSAWKSSKRQITNNLVNNNYSNIIFDFNKLTFTATHLNCNKQQTFNIGDTIRCYTCYPKQISSFENEVCAYLDSLKIKYELHNRHTIYPLELDIFIDSHNLAIECNGDYWHSYNSPESVAQKFKHLNKTMQCENKNIRLIQIPEHLWHSRNNQIKGIIKSALNLNDVKIQARKTKIKDVKSNDARTFLNDNHIRGFIPASKYIGLYSNNELVQVMSLSTNRFKKDKSWEVIRSASKINVTVIGGVNKLLSYCSNLLKCDLTIYVDRLMFSGKSLKISCVEQKSSSPGYVWLYSGKVLSRYKCQKSKLSNILKEKFNPLNTEVNNMFNAGALRLWDCGNLVFIYKYVH